MGVTVVGGENSSTTLTTARHPTAVWDRDHSSWRRKLHPTATDRNTQDRRGKQFDYAHCSAPATAYSLNKSPFIFWC